MKFREYGKKEKGYNHSVKIFKVLFWGVLLLTLTGCLTPNPWGGYTTSSQNQNSSWESPSSIPSSSETTSSYSSPEPTSNSSLPVETSEEGSSASPTFSPQVSPMEISRGVPGKMRVSLTFDCGAGRGYIDQILETLTRNGIPATFFVTGSWAENNPDDVRRISEFGYRIGNHTQNHLYLTEISDEEIKSELSSVEETVLKLTGKSTRPLFRAPYGNRDERVLQVVASQGYWSIYWTIDSLDWQEGHDPGWVKDRILSRLEDGAIILCHVASEYTYLVLQELIGEIQSRGFSFVPIEDFLELSP